MIDFDMDSNYAALWGLRTKRMTIFSVSIILIFPLFAWWQTPSSEPLSLRIVLLLIPLVLLGGTYLRRVVSYSLTERGILIQRVLGQTVFPYNRITAIKKMPYVTEQSIRVFGNGGMFGFNGRFRNTILGTYLAYVTDPANCVVLEMANQMPVVISPERPDQFVSEAKTLSLGTDETC